MDGARSPLLVALYRHQRAIMLAAGEQACFSSILSALYVITFLSLVRQGWGGDCVRLPGRL